MNMNKKVSNGIITDRHIKIKFSDLYSQKNRGNNTHGFSVRWFIIRKDHLQYIISDAFFQTSTNRIGFGFSLNNRTPLFLTFILHFRRMT